MSSKLEYQFGKEKSIKAMKGVCGKKTWNGDKGKESASW
jgi:hypothetical protein